MQNAMSARKKSGDVSPIANKVIRPLIGIFNPLVMRVAGTRWVPIWSLLHHRGHRTGRMYVTPVTVIPRGGWFWMGLMFGQDAGWTRNVLAAGDADIRYRGVDYHLVEPTVFEVAAVRSEFPAFARVFMRLVGMRTVLRLRAG